MSFAFSKTFAPAFAGAINYSEYIVTGTPNPVVGTQATSDISGTIVVVTNIIRYNGGGKFTCSIADLANTNFGIMDVYYDPDAEIWRAKEYIPTRYRDEDGVKKGL